MGSAVVDALRTVTACYLEAAPSLLRRVSDRVDPDRGRGADSDTEPDFDEPACRLWGSCCTHWEDYAEVCCECGTRYSERVAR